MLLGDRLVTPACKDTFVVKIKMGGKCKFFKDFIERNIFAINSRNNLKKCFLKFQDLSFIKFIIQQKKINHIIIYVILNLQLKMLDGTLKYMFTIYCTFQLTLFQRRNQYRVTKFQICNVNILNIKFILFLFPCFQAIFILF